MCDSHWKSGGYNIPGAKNAQRGGFNSSRGHEEFYKAFESF